MPVSATNWQALFTARGNVLSTEMNTLADSTRTAPGTALDNGVNNDQYGKLQLDVTFGTAPSAGGYVNIYAVYAPDGTNYEDGSATVAPAATNLVAAIPVRAITTAQKLTTRLFLLEPAPVKFIVENKAGQSTAASANTLKLFTTNDEAQ